MFLESGKGETKEGDEEEISFYLVDAPTRGLTGLSVSCSQVNPAGAISLHPSTTF